MFIGLISATFFYIGLSFFEGALTFNLPSVFWGKLEYMDDKAVALKMRHLALITFIRVPCFVVFVFLMVFLSLNWFDNLWIAFGCVNLFLLLLVVLRAAFLRMGMKYSFLADHVITPILIPLSWILHPVLVVRNLLICEKAFARSEQPNMDTNGENGGNEFNLEEQDRENKMIRAIMHLEEVTAREVMVPRVDLVAVEANASLGAVLELMSEGGKSRIPAYKETLDKVVGIVHARDVLKYFAGGKSGDLENAGEIARPPVFVPESKPLDQLLREFQDQRVTIGMVVDEYGGVEGLITMEDIVEEIVGEIEDELDQEKPRVIRVDRDTIIVDAGMSLDIASDLLKVKLEGDGFDTLGGFLYEGFGKIPVPGDELIWDNIQLKVLSTTGRRIRKVSITLRSQTA